MSTSDSGLQGEPAPDAPSVRSIKDYHAYIQREVLGLQSHAIGEKPASDHAIIDGWKAIGVLLGILGVSGGMSIADKLGLEIFKVDHRSVTLSVLKWMALLASLFNLWSWATNPQQDLETLRTWLVTPTQKHNLNNNHRLTMIVQIFLVCLVCFSAMVNPIAFGAAGALVYLVNFIGFFVVMRHVRLAVAAAKQSCDEDAPEFAKPFLHRGIQCIEGWWAVGPDDRGLWNNRLQRRHLILMATFSIVAVLGLISWKWDFTAASCAAYLVGIAGLVYAVVSISLLRSAREDLLDDIDAGWIAASKPTGGKRGQAPKSRAPGA